VAVRGPAGWRYEDNPRGGVEVWHGSPEHAGSGGFTPPSGGASLFSFDAEDDWSEPFHDEKDLASSADLEATAVLAELSRQTEEDRPFLTRTHEPSAGQRDLLARAAIDPGVRLTQIHKDLLGLNEDCQEEIDAYFAGGGLRSVGYWRRRTGPPRAACAQLLTELLALRPGNDRGNVLAVGSGSELQAELARRLPKARVQAQPCWDAAPHEQFDLLLWIEGPALRPKSQDLCHAWERLAPGGVLLASTLVGAPFDVALAGRATADPRDLAEAGRTALAAAGFVEPQAHDVTRTTWLRFQCHCREYFFTKLMFRQIDETLHREILNALPGGGLVVEGYLLLAGRRQE
jgi:hypothetical protein